MPVTENWMPARLIPTAGIRGEEEQERRATSALLAVMTVVPDFARAVLGHMRAPAGRVQSFCEVPLKGESSNSRPDGAILVERGKTSWSCLVEVKTGKSELRDEQMGRYVDLARQHGFDGVLSISNQIALQPTELPYGLDGRRIGKLQVKHLSWWEILTEAVIHYEHRGVDDFEQAYLLGQLIAYLTDEKSGARGFSDMGPNWVAVRESVAAGNLKPQDPKAVDVAHRWNQFVRYLTLSLSQALGRDVKAQSKADVVATLKRLCADGVLSTTVKVPDAAGSLLLEADLRASRFTTAVVLDAPKDKQRAQASINWLLKQVDRDIAEQVIEVAFAGGRETTVAKLADVESADDLVSQVERKRLPRKFTVSLTRKMGARRAGGKGFVTEAERQVVDFYRDIVQSLRAPQPRAPKLPEPQAREVTDDSGSGNGAVERPEPLRDLGEARVPETGPA